MFRNLPLRISYRGELILRGEAVISYPDFEKINESLGEQEVRYKNPRNLCSGSVRQLDSAVTARRRVRFYAFTLVEAVSGEEAADTKQGNPDFHNSRLEQLRFLEKQGFETVETMAVTGQTVAEAVDTFEKRITGFDIPSDGLVLTLEDLEYARSLGRTAKFPKDSIAFKWADEISRTHLKYIETSDSSGHSANRQAYRTSEDHTADCSDSPTDTS